MGTDSNLEKDIPLEDHYIDPCLRHVINHGEKPWTDMSDNDKSMLAKVK